MTDRRTFLKTTALAGAAAADGVPFTATTLLAQKAAVGSQDDCARFRILDLAPSDRLRPRRAHRSRHSRCRRRRQGLCARMRRRRSRCARGRGRSRGLRRLMEKAKDSHFVAIDKAAFGPCVTHPEKIICVGLNYRKHAAETGNPVPKPPILFNKFNTALNGHRGVIKVSAGGRRRSSTTRPSSSS